MGLIVRTSSKRVKRKEKKDLEDSKSSQVLRYYSRDGKMMGQLSMLGSHHIQEAGHCGCVVGRFGHPTFHIRHGPAAYPNSYLGRLSGIGVVVKGRLYEGTRSHPISVLLNVMLYSHVYSTVSQESFLAASSSSAARPSTSCSLSHPLTLSMTRSSSMPPSSTSSRSCTLMPLRWSVTLC